MDTQQLQRIVEGALLAAGVPLSIKRLSELFDEGDAPSPEAFAEALNAISEQCEERGFLLKEVASGWRLQVREELAPWRSEEHTSELQSRPHLVCRLLLEKKKQ